VTCSLKIAPNLVEAWCNLGVALVQQGHLEAGIEKYRQALLLVPDHVLSYLNLGRALEQLGQTQEAIQCYEIVLTLVPHHQEAQVYLQKLYARLVPPWHFPMMNDTYRNALYERAIENLVRSGDVVLDIGAGSGLLAMMAARAGAEQVFTCEIVPPIAAAAAAIVEGNGLAAKVTVIPKKSTALVVGEDLPKPADLLICEIFDVGLLAEDVIPTLKHAKEYLLCANARMIPRAAAVFAACIESEAL